MITWAKLALAAVQLAVYFTTYLREKNLISQGEANVIGNIYAQQAVLLGAAEEIRKRLTDDFSRDHSSIMRHDKYERDTSGE